MLLKDYPVSVYSGIELSGDYNVASCNVTISATTIPPEESLLNLQCLTMCVSGSGRSGRTSSRRSSFWDSCDTQTRLSTKAAT